MDEGRLEWCLKQNKGIILIETKPHLSESYMKEADDTLENVFTANGKWKLITAYYSCYNALYSILMKCGIKSEIHDCTIELMAVLGFSSSDIRYMTKLKEDRIQAQYYLKNIMLRDESKVKEFVLGCKSILEGIDSGKIEEIRYRIKKKSKS